MSVDFIALTGIQVQPGTNSFFYENPEENNGVLFKNYQKRTLVMN